MGIEYYIAVENRTPKIIAKFIQMRQEQMEEREQTWQRNMISKKKVQERYNSLFHVGTSMATAPSLSFMLEVPLYFLEKLPDKTKLYTLEESLDHTKRDSTNDRGGIKTIENLRKYLVQSKPINIFTNPNKYDD